MHRTRRGLGVAEGQMECCTSQESYSRASCRTRLTMRRNSGRYQRRGSLHRRRHLVSGVGSPHMSTLRRLHRPQGVRREDHVGDCLCSCASRGRRVSKSPPKSLNPIFQQRYRVNEQGHTHQKPARKRWHLPSWWNTSLPVPW